MYSFKMFKISYCYVLKKNLHGYTTQTYLMTKCISIYLDHRFTFHQKKNLRLHDLNIYEGIHIYFYIEVLITTKMKKKKKEHENDKLISSSHPSFFCCNL